MKSNPMMALAVYLMFTIFPAVVATAQNTTCKCGPDCKCRQGDHSECKCGPNCQCHVSHGAAHQHGNPVSENAFLKMMDEMMVKMDAVPLSASVERNFLVQMVPHHTGALEMARYEIENGTDFEMVQLAKSILAEQKIEIMEMHVLIKSYPSDGTVTSNYKTAMDKTMMVMMEKSPVDKDLTGSVDCSFAMVMLPHHQAAVDMAVAVLKFNPAGPVAAYAQRMIANQQVEIEQMGSYIQQHCKK